MEVERLGKRLIKECRKGGIQESRKASKVDRKLVFESSC